MATIDEYLREIAQIALLIPVEEQSIIETVQQKGGNCEEMAKLEKANSRFVASLSLQYQGQGRTFWQLIEAGNEGLRNAALQYRPESGISFIQFAVPFIREEMQRKNDE